MRELTQRCQIQAPQQLVFESFTKASELREWLCDRAYTRPRPEGSYWLRWHDGPKVEGQYIEVTPPNMLSFVWRTAEAPGETTVSITLQASEKGTEVTLIHSGFGSEPHWRPFIKQCAEYWSEGLANLKSVLETGIDLRRAQRPYLGITWEQADTGGIRVLQARGGHGAEVSQLQPGDVILEIGDRAVSDYETLLDALESCHPGVKVNLVVMRDGAERLITIKPGAMARSEMALDARSLLAGVRDRQIRMQRLLSDTLHGTTEREASIRPTPEAWSVKEILAHLSVTERNLHHHLWQIAMFGWDDTPKGDPALLPEALAAAMTRTDTLSKLLDRFAQDQAETLAFFSALHPAIVGRKGRYHRLAESLDMSEHTLEHINQIASTLKAVREQVKKQSRSLGS